MQLFAIMPTSVPLSSFTELEQRANVIHGWLHDPSQLVVIPLDGKYELQAKDVFRFRIFIGNK